jgi:hypothetical protein
MSDVCLMFLDSCVNCSSCLSNVGLPTCARNLVNTFVRLGTNWVLDHTKELLETLTTLKEGVHECVDFSQTFPFHTTPWLAITIYSLLIVVISNQLNVNIHQ